MGMQRMDFDTIAKRMATSFAMSVSPTEGVAAAYPGLSSSIISGMRLARVSITNGLVSTRQSGARCSLPKMAFSRRRALPTGND
jgi:hypothetical protein